MKFLFFGERLFRRLFFFLCSEGGGDTSLLRSEMSPPPLNTSQRCVPQYPLKPTRDVSPITTPHPKPSYHFIFAIVFNYPFLFLLLVNIFINITC